MSHDKPSSPWHHLHTPEARYREDGQFKGLVDMLEAFIGRAQYTPTELREAAILAATHHAMRQPNPLRYVGSALAPDLPHDRDVKPGSPPPVVIVDGVRYTLDTSERGKSEMERAGAELLPAARHTAGVDPVRVAERLGLKP